MGPPVAAAGVAGPRARAPAASATAAPSAAAGRRAGMLKGELDKVENPQVVMESPRRR